MHKKIIYPQLFTFLFLKNLQNWNGCKNSEKNSTSIFFFFNEIYKIKISIDLFYWGILSNELRL